MLSQRIGYIDIMKGIAIICVVVGHYIGNPYLRVAIWSFHLPLFVFLNGYFYKKKSFVDRLTQSIKAYLIPYLIVLLLLLLFELFFARLGRIDLSYKEIINRRLLSGIWGLHSNSVINKPTNIVKIGAIWFLLALFWGNLMMAIVRTLCKNKLSQLIIVSFFLIAAVLQMHYCCLPLGIDYGCAFLIWIWIGAFYRELLVSGNSIIKKVDSDFFVIPFIAIWLGVIATEGLTGHRFSLPSLAFPLYGLEIIGAFSGIMVIKWISSQIEDKCRLLSSMLKFIGRNSIWLLCVHSLDLELYEYVIEAKGAVFSTIHCIIDIVFAILLSFCVEAFNRRKNVMLSRV